MARLDEDEYKAAVLLAKWNGKVPQNKEHLVKRPEFKHAMERLRGRGLAIRRSTAFRLTRDGQLALEEVRNAKPTQSV